MVIEEHNVFKIVNCINIIKDLNLIIPTINRQDFVCSDVHKRNKIFVSLNIIFLNVDHVFTNCIFINIDFNKLKSLMDGYNFKNCKFIGCRFKGNLNKITFNQCKFNKTNFEETCNQYDVQFFKCKFVLCDFVSELIKNTMFRKCKFDFLNFQSVRIVNSIFRYNNFRKSVFQSNVIYLTNMDYNKFYSVDFFNSEFNSSNFHKCNFKSSLMEACYFKNLTLYSNDLIGLDVNINCSIEDVNVEFINYGDRYLIKEVYELFNNFVLLINLNKKLLNCTNEDCLNVILNHIIQNKKFDNIFKNINNAHELKTSNANLILLVLITSINNLYNGYVTESNFTNIIDIIYFVRDLIKQD